MFLRHPMLPPGADALLGITGAKAFHDPHAAVFALSLPRYAKRGQVMYYRFRIFPDLEDWQDAVRQVVELHEDAP